MNCLSCVQRLLTPPYCMIMEGAFWHQYSIPAHPVHILYFILPPPLFHQASFISFLPYASRPLLHPASLTISFSSLLYLIHPPPLLHHASCLHHGAVLFCFFHLFILPPSLLHHDSSIAPPCLLHCFTTPPLLLSPASSTASFSPLLFFIFPSPLLHPAPSNSPSGPLNFFILSPPIHHLAPYLLRWALLHHLASSSASSAPSSRSPRPLFWLFLI